MECKKRILFLLKQVQLSGNVIMQRDLKIPNLGKFKTFQTLVVKVKIDFYLSEKLKSLPYNSAPYCINFQNNKSQIFEFY